MIFSRMLAGVDQSILRSTRNPLLNHEERRCETSRSSAARSVCPFIMPSRSARMLTRSPVPPGAPCLDRLRHAFPIRTEIAHQCFEEGATSRRIQLLVDVEHLTRHGGARSFAPARQQRAAKLDEPI